MGIMVGACIDACQERHHLKATFVFRQAIRPKQMYLMLSDLPLSTVQTALHTQNHIHVSQALIWRLVLAHRADDARDILEDSKGDLVALVEAQRAEDSLLAPGTVSTIWTSTYSYQSAKQMLQMHLWHCRCKSQVLKSCEG